MLTEEKLDAIHSKLKTSPRRSLKLLAQVTIVSVIVCAKGHKVVTTATVKDKVVPALKEHGQFARIHSGITQRLHPTRDTNKFRRRTADSERLPQLY